MGGAGNRWEDLEVMAKKNKDRRKKEMKCLVRKVIEK